MRTFKLLKKQKLSDPSFKRLYDQDCHVCRTTVKISEILIKKQISIETVSKELGCSIKDIEDLMDAEYCDPVLVQHLCRYLSIKIPDNCPRLQ